MQLHACMQEENYPCHCLLWLIMKSKCMYMFRAFWQLAQFRNCVAQIGGYQFARSVSKLRISCAI